MVFKFLEFLHIVWSNSSASVSGNENKKMLEKSEILLSNWGLFVQNTKRVSSLRNKILQEKNMWWRVFCQWERRTLIAFCFNLRSNYSLSKMMTLKFLPMMISSGMKKRMRSIQEVKVTTGQSLLRSAHGWKRWVWASPQSWGTCGSQRSELRLEPMGCRVSWGSAGMGVDPGLYHPLTVWPQAGYWTSLSFDILVRTVEFHQMRWNLGWLSSSIREHTSLKSDTKRHLGGSVS